MLKFRSFGKVMKITIFGDVFLIVVYVMYVECHCQISFIEAAEGPSDFLRHFGDLRNFQIL